MDKTSKPRREYHQESFEKRHRRVTLYLERDVYDELMYRREQSRIKNQTAFISHVLRDYFTKHP